MFHGRFHFQGLFQESPLNSSTFQACANPVPSYHCAKPTTSYNDKRTICTISETVLPIYSNGRCPLIKTCSDVTFNLSSDSNSVQYVHLSKHTRFWNLSHMQLEEAHTSLHIRAVSTETSLLMRTHDGRCRFIVKLRSLTIPQYD